MKYRYEDLSPTQFEELIIFLCKRLLGAAVQGFAVGPDGGRDAKFVGTAQLIPSTAAPWGGTVIIQAKHTNGYNTSFSDKNFFSDASQDTVIGKEIPRIKNLIESGELDHYMLFSNRRLTGGKESEIRSYLSQECGLPQESIILQGIEELERWMKKYPDIPELADLDPVDSPLIVSPEDLSEIIEALSSEIDNITAEPDSYPTPRIPYEEKNRINKMTAEYAKELRKQYLEDTVTIDAFLAAPENDDLKQLYESITEEFNLKIIAHRKEYQTFDQVMNYLFDQLFSRDTVLRAKKNKRLTRAMLFYMYWICDIGKEEEDAETN